MVKLKEKLKDKKFVYLLIAIMGVTSLLIGSYAFINVRLSGSKKQVIKSGSLTLTLDEKDGITLANALPAYDEVGMLSEPYIFTLNNKSAFAMKYSLKLVDVTESEEVLAYEDLRYGLTKNGVTTFGSIAELDNLLIDTGTIASEEENSYEFRMWINYEVTDEERINGKSRTFKVVIESTRSNDDIILAATLDGEAVATFPTREDNLGVESITCSDDLSASFDPVTWSVTVDGIVNSNTSCIVNFSSSITLDETDEALTMTKSELYAFYKGTFSSSATSSEVLSGKTVYINGVETTGTMPNNGSVSSVITTSGGTYTIPAGYHDGTGTVTGPTLESLVGSNVTLENSANLLLGVTAYGKNGVKYTGTNKGYDAGYNDGQSSFVYKTGTTTANGYDLWTTVDLGWQPRVVILTSGKHIIVYSSFASQNYFAGYNKEEAGTGRLSVTSSGFSWYAAGSANNSTMTYLAIK